MSVVWAMAISWAAQGLADDVQPAGQGGVAEALRTVGPRVVDRADHAGVVRAAVLRAEKMILARLARLEPDARIAARQNVHMDPEGRDKEAVNDVLGSHHKLKGLADRYVQFVDLALTLGVLDLPHPLLSDDINFGSVLGRSAFLEIDQSSPAKDHHKNEEMNCAPCNFQRSRALDLLSPNPGAS